MIEYMLGNSLLLYFSFYMICHFGINYNNYDNQKKNEEKVY